MLQSASVSRPQQKLLGAGMQEKVAHPPRQILLQKIFQGTVCVKSSILIFILFWMLLKMVPKVFFLSWLELEKTLIF